MHENPFVHIGSQDNGGYRGGTGIRTKDRRQHLYVVGKTGTGKTTLLRNLIIQDIHHGHGVAVLDPHGDMAEELLSCIPGSRVDDVVYFDPSDWDFPIGLNLLKTKDASQRHLVASGIVSVFKNIWPDSWGPRLEYILYICTASLLECENVSLLGIPRLLSDDQYRRWVVRQIEDPMLLQYWTHEFPRYSKSFLAEVISPVQNKVGQMLLAPFMRNILGQVKSKLDMGFIMDNRRIFIANLSKGKIGEDKAHLLGSLLVTQFQIAAMARASIPEEKREDFFMYVDEFQNFTTDSFASLLSEARKYRLNLTLSHQYLSQLREGIRDAVLGNAGSIITFRVGQQDAKLLEGEFAEDVIWKSLTELPNYRCYAKLLEDGEEKAAKLCYALPPIVDRYKKSQAIRKRSRERYAKHRTIVEEKIWRWIRN